MVDDVRLTFLPINVLTVLTDKRIHSLGWFTAFVTLN